MEIRIALAGNPNCGKTTLFNVLTGSTQFVGNWPGVTVEKKEGYLKNTNSSNASDKIILTDLPGIYSMSPYTLEEVVARKYLVGERPDAILDIVDGTNIERNLYLTTQLTELGIPVVIAVNMMDLVEKNGDKIDIQGLSKALGCPVVTISALKGTGINEAADAAIAAAKRAAEPDGKMIPHHAFSGAVEHALAHIEEACLHNMPQEQQRWYAIKIFERDEKVLAELKLPEATMTHIEADIKAAERECDDDAEAIITNERYNYIAHALSGCYTKKSLGALSASAKIDRIVTGKYTALPIFALIMFAVYTISIGTIGGWTVEFMNETVFGAWIIPAVTRFLTESGCAAWLISLVSDGVLAGVGSVLGFVPQMFILFFLLSILEDIGYMARVAFIMDKVFRKFGLSGKSFIPMLIATGCGVPGIMASRTIEQERDRRMTVMTTGFIPCGAKMPMVGMIASALFGGSALIAVSAYFVGVAAVIVSGRSLKKTRLFAGDPSPFVMELPAYHAPTPKNIMRGTWERGFSFVKRAGTVILLASVVIWILNSLSFENGFHYIAEGDTSRSILMVVGGVIAVLFIPLGFGSWQTAVAALLGLLAKEQIVSVLGSLASMANSAVSDSDSFALIGTEIFGGSAIAGYSFMIFNLLCAPCIAAMSAIRREMNSGRWTAFALAYMCIFAYAVSLMIYQFGSFFSGNGSVPGVIAAACILALMIYLLVRKGYKPNKASAKV